MQAANQPNNRTLLYLIVGVFIIALVWWAGPQLYVSVYSTLPVEWTRQANISNEMTSEQFAQLEAQVSELKTENRRLRVTSDSQLTDISTTTLPSDFQPARVLARPPQTPYDVLLIDGGRQQGITTGAVVWWPPGVYLGEVVEVREESSLVRLVSSSGVRHVGRIDARITAVTQGRGGGGMTATVPAETDIATGSLVVSDRWGAPFARVVDREPAAALAEQRLFFQPIISASVIENIYVEQ